MIYGLDKKNCCACYLSHNRKAGSTTAQHPNINPSIHHGAASGCWFTLAQFFPLWWWCAGGCWFTLGNFDPILQVQYSFSTNPARTLYRNKIQSWCVSVSLCVCVCVCLPWKECKSLVNNIRRLLEILLSGSGHSETDFARRRHIHGWVFEVWTWGLGLRLMLLPLNHYVVTKLLIPDLLSSIKNQPNSMSSSSSPPWQPQNIAS
jgi:hypothetical protein